MEEQLHKDGDHALQTKMDCKPRHTRNSTTASSLPRLSASIAIVWTAQKPSRLLAMHCCCSGVVAGSLCRRPCTGEGHQKPLSTSQNPKISHHRHSISPSSPITSGEGGGGVLTQRRSSKPVERIHEQLDLG
ncbi:hypothetical protein Sjap_014965 [Stephania japonica]|uniref:Uncharacterized protein n=1 Tax=Stephania japonica TaxID=461633 RepID=A0AAP0NQY3_9MAGN